MTYAELSEAQARRSRQFAEAQTDAMSVYCDAERDLKELQAENARLRELCADLYAEMITYSNAPNYNASSGGGRMTAKWQYKEAYEAALVTARELRAENAKLRELVLDLYCLAYPTTVEWEVSDATYDKYSPCEKCHELHGGKSPCASTAKDMTEECCAPIQANVVADRMRELGVEVSDD